MNLKQKLSFLAASALPVLALSAYFLFSPVKTSAGGLCHAPCGYEGTGCMNGAGYCYNDGSNGIFVFCRNSNGQPTGPGNCEDGWVTCTYGGYC